MKRGSKKPIKARRVWPRNPNTRVKESARAYNRRREKKLRNCDEEQRGRN